MAEEEQTPEQKSRQEGQKLLYDSVKHLTTLSTGSILILIALLEKFFKTPEWPYLIAVGFLSLTLSTLGSVITMIILSNSVFYFREDVELGSKKGALVFYFSLGAFILGIGSIVFFALKNFY
jgi:hypothetical protein